MCRICPFSVTLLFILLFGVASNIIAQNRLAQLSGQVLMPDNTPAAFVTVQLKNNGITTNANENGKFMIGELPASEDSLIISGIGVVTFKQSIKLTAGHRLDLGIIQIGIVKKTLQNVEITGRLSRSYKSDYSFAATKTQTSLIDIPQSLSTATKELINDKMQLHLTNALENIAGVTHYSGYEEYTIRGLRAENARLINGLRVFNTSLTSPLLVNIERVELIKGPAAVLYGNCDPGGTINLVTKKPLREKQYAAFVSAGSQKAFNGQLDVTGPLNKKASLLYRINAGYENTQSFRDGYFLKAYQAAPSFSFIPNSRLQVNLDLCLAYTSTIADRGQPGLKATNYLLSTPISRSVMQPTDYLKETNLSAVLSATYQINQNISFNSSLLHYYTNQKLSEHGIGEFITNDSVYLSYHNNKLQTHTNTFSNYFSFQFNKRKIKHQILVGYDYISNNLKGGGWEGKLAMPGTNDVVVGTISLLHPQYKNRNANAYQQIVDTAGGADLAEGIYSTNGFYVQEYLTYRKWLVMAGVRAEFFESGDEEDAGSGKDDETEVSRLMPRLGITYAANSNTRLYASYNTGFDPFEPGAVTQVFNEPFKPVTSYMFETGIKATLLNNKLFSTLAVYQIIINNLAVNANAPANPDLFVQRGAQRSRGVEWELQGNLTKNLSVNINYAFNETKITKSIKSEDLGRIAENAPRHSSGSWIKYEFLKGFLQGLAVSLGHTQAGPRSTLDPGLHLPGYIDWSGAIQYGYRHFKIAINLNNISNTVYWAAAYNNLYKWPGSARNLMARLYYTF